MRSILKYMVVTTLSFIPLLSIITIHAASPPQDTTPLQQQRFQSLTATELGVNALTLPASGQTAQSNIVDLRGATALTLITTCTQPMQIGAKFYNVDGITDTIGQTGLETTTVTAGNTALLHLSNQQNPTGFAKAVGQLSTTTTIELPQRAISFYFANTGATAGTCTASLMLQLQ